MLKAKECFYAVKNLVKLNSVLILQLIKLKISRRENATSIISCEIRKLLIKRY